MTARDLAADERGTAERVRLLTGPFTAWLAAAVVAGVGDGILYFAIGWAATGLGGQTAGWLLTLVVLPRAVLMLVGGAAGDRWGLRRTMVGCDVVMVVVLGCYLLLARAAIPAVVMLAGLALAVGTVSAFRMPAAGAFPRVFVRDEDVSRAMSLTGSLLQVARMAGPPLGGVAVGVLGATGALSGTLAALLLSAAVLLAVRPPYEQPPDPAERSAWTRIREGLAAARAVPGVLPLLGAVALVAGTLIPLLSLCLPLAARERGWGPGWTGTVEATWVLGSLLVSLVVARTGARARATGPLLAGPLLSGLGALVLAASPVPPQPALAGALVMGAGTALFTSHAFPLYVLRTPEGMLARFQALLGVVQAAAMLVGNNVLGAVGGHAGATEAVVAAGAACLAASLVVGSSRALRAARTVPD